MRISIRVMQCCPIKLIRTPRLPGPLQQVTCPLIPQRELHKRPTEDAVSAASNDVNVVRWIGVSRASFHHFSNLSLLQPFILETESQHALSMYSFDVVGAVVNAHNSDHLLDSFQRKTLSGRVDDVLPVATAAQVILHAVDVSLQSTVSGPRDPLESRRQADVVEAGDERRDGRLEAGRRLGVDVNTVDIVGPIDGAKQSNNLLGVAVNDEIEREREVGDCRVDGVAETVGLAERRAVGRLLDELENRIFWTRNIWFELDGGVQRLCVTA